jgi:hypothetical protein
MTVRAVDGSMRADVNLFLVGGLVSVAALTLEAGALGAAVGLVGIGAAVMTTGFYGVAVHHVGAVAVVDAVTLPGLVLLEAAAVFLLLSDPPASHRLTTGSLLIPLVVVLGVATATVATNWSLLDAVLALVTLVVVGTYALHRYARVGLGLESEETVG